MKKELCWGGFFGYMQLVRWYQQTFTTFVMRLPLNATSMILTWNWKNVIWRNCYLSRCSTDVIFVNDSICVAIRSLYLQLFGPLNWLIATLISNILVPCYLEYLAKTNDHYNSYRTVIYCVRNSIETCHVGMSYRLESKWFCFEIKWRCNY